jgi:hypothetical protein
VIRGLARLVLTLVSTTSSSAVVERSRLSFSRVARSSTTPWAAPSSSALTGAMTVAAGTSGVDGEESEVGGVSMMIQS